VVAVLARRLLAATSVMLLWVSACTGSTDSDETAGTVAHAALDTIAPVAAASSETMAPPEDPSDLSATPSTAQQTVTVTVKGLGGLGGGDLAGVLSHDPDGTVVGGFAAKVVEENFTTTEMIMRPGDPEASESADLGGNLWPHVTDEVALVEPGVYTLMMWADTGLEGYSRWVPANSDGAGLTGCVYSFEVSEHQSAHVVLDGDFAGLGYVGICRDDPAAFTFATDDLCDWVSEDEIAEFVAAEFDWDGTATEIDTRNAEGCSWELTSETTEPATLGFIAPTGLTIADEVDHYELGDEFGIGSQALGHPYLSDGVAYYLQGFGPLAFGVPDDDRWFVLDDSPDIEAWPAVSEDAFWYGWFGVADRLIEELGWTP
jgi:hypothetical protein